MTETLIFRPSLAKPIKYFLFHTCLFTVLLYLWNTLENWIYLAIAFIPLIGIVGLGKPLLFFTTCYHRRRQNYHDSVLVWKGLY